MKVEKMFINIEDPKGTDASGFRNTGEGKKVYFESQMVPFLMNF